MDTSIKKKRESGIELLRIFAAMGVIVSHYCNYNGAFASTLQGGLGGGKLQLTPYVSMRYGVFC